MRMNDVFDQKIIERFDIKPEVKKMSKKKLLQLLNNLFKEEYQGKTVTYAMLEKEYFVKITAKTRIHFGFKNKSASYKGHQTKLHIGASGDYMALISNCEYTHSADEKKREQNVFHENTEKWHYFSKTILCEGTYYQVVVDVNENKSNELMVYNVSLAPCKGNLVLQKEDEIDKNKRDSMHSAEADLRDGISCDDILSYNKENVNDNSEKCSKNSNKDIKKASLVEQVKRAEAKKEDYCIADKALTHENERD